MLLQLRRTGWQVICAYDAIVAVPRSSGRSPDAGIANLAAGTLHGKHSDRACLGC